MKLVHPLHLGGALLASLFVLSGCQNPLGGASTVDPDHLPAIGQPSSFSFTSVVAEAGQVSLSWSAATNASGYTVRYGTASGYYPSTFCSGTTSTSCTVTGLMNGLTYHFIVVASNGGGSQTIASEAVATPVGAPVGLSARAGVSNVALTWTATSGASSYNILRGTSSGVLSAFDTSATNSYTDVTAVAGTTYFYAVQSITGGVTSDSSSEVSGRPVGAFAITSASITSASAIRLTWGASTGATAYTIKYGTSSGVYGTTFSTTATSPTNVTGLTAGTTYYFMVSATNAVGTGASGDANAETSGVPIGAFTISSAAGGNTQAVVTWAAATGATAGAYTLKYGTASGVYGSTFSTTASSPTTVTGLTNGTPYYFMVTATNALSGGVDATAEATGTPLGVPAGLAATVGISNVALAWTATTSATSYNVMRGTTSGSLSLLSTSATNSYTDLTAVAGTTYYYAVQAVNGSGTSANSSEVSGRPVGTFAITATDITTSSAIRLTWGASTGATAYTIKYGTATGVYGTTFSTTATSPTNVTGLTPGTTYYFMVTATNAVGSTASGNATAESTGVPIGAFTISSVVPGDSEAVVTWGAATGATAGAYTLKYGTATGVYGTTVSTTATSPVTVTGLSNGVPYYFMVTATNALSGGVNATAEGNATPIGPPSGLTAAPGISNVALSWTAMAGATSYNIMRGTVSGTLALLGTSATNSYTDLTAVAGTTYYYAVQAVNGGGTTASSSEASGRPVGAFTISATDITSASAIRLTWGASTGATAFTIKYGTATGVYGTTFSTTATSPTNVTGLTPGTTYYFMVTATNAVGSGANGNASAESTGVPISAFTISSVAAGNTQTVVTWGAATGATAGAYTVKYGTATGVYGSTFSTTATSPTTVTGLTNGTTYYFMVTATNALSGGVDATAEVSTTPLGVPAGLAATVGVSNVALAWTATTSATSYNIMRGTISGALTLLDTSATNSYTDLTAVAGTTYYYAVQAVNGSGTSANSSEVFGRPVGAFTISATDITTSSAIRLTWGASTGSTAFTIKYGTSTGVYGTTFSTTATSPTNVTGLTPGTTYYFMVSATNAVGSGASGNATAESTGVPIGAFTISSVAAGNTQATVTWGAATGATAGAYTLKYGTATGVYGTTVSTTATSPVTVTGLTNGTPYYFMVVATNALSGGVNATAEVAATPIGIPVGLAATVGTSNVALAWTATTGATSYNIMRGTVSGTLSLLDTSATNSYTDLTALAGTTYYYAVQAVNSGGTSASSSEVFGRPVGAFSISATDITTSSAIRLTWGASTGAAAYTIQYGTVSGTYGTTFSTSATSPTNVTGLTPGTTYYFRVYATNAIGSTASGASSAETSGVPIAAFAITGHTPAGTDTTTGTVALTWASATGATAYTVKYGTGTGVYGTTFSTSATSPTTVTGLAAGTTYYFMVTATNALSGGVDATSEASQYPYRTFASAFDFNSSVTYNAGTGADILGGVGRLTPNDTVDDSTNGATTPTDDFDDYLSKDANITVAGSKITLAPAGSDNLTGGLSASWTPQYSSITGYWKFDSAAGAIAAGATVPATIGTDGTMTGALATYTTGGKIGNAFTYPTVNASTMLKIGDGSQYNYDTSSFSISFWYKIASGAHSPKYILGKGVSSNTTCGSDAGWYLYNWYTTDPAALLSNYTDGCAATTAGSTWTGAFGSISRNVWNHIAIVVSRTGVNATSTLSVYLNGAKGPPYTFAYLTDATGRITISNGAGTEFRLGGHTGAGVNQYAQGVSYDELAIWNTALTAAEVGKIYNTQRSTYSGEFKSRIMDGLQTTSDWTSLKFISSLPFGKEISGGGAETGYGSSVTDFTNGLKGYWNFNDTTGVYVDRSGNSNDLTLQGGGWASRGTSSIFNTATRWSIYGVNAGVNSGATKASSATLDLTGALTISAWVNSSTVNTIVVPEYIARMGISGTDERYGLWVKPDGTVGYDHYNGTTTETVSSAAGAHIPSAWNFITMTRAANGLDVELFVNGTSVKTGSAVTAPTTAGTPTFSVARTDVNTGGFSGMIDELAVWNRVLTGAEITELYKRGIARTKVQVRACADATCTANPSFVGFDGLNSSYFTEQNNNAAPVTGIGATAATPMQSLWTTIASGSAGFSTWLASNKNLQYIQYRAVLEGEHATYVPDLTSVSFLPSPRYVVSNPMVYNLAATAISFAQITGFSVSGATCTGGTMVFELSDGGAAWKYWNGSAWAASTGYATANSAATLSALSIANWSSFPNATGSLYIRAYLPSSGSTACSIDNVAITGYNP